ncbi:MAG: type II toxin-antitoxin system VapC family toxin [Nitrospirae bacterium]|nr:type II toxin-antitoxin system VapC family toxin [Candidatus Manganitrophaceae bacterium]
MSKAEGLILLDTHVWIWLLNGNDQLISKTCLSVINQSVQSSNIRVSAISIWELGMLESKGRIHIPTNCLDWVNKALEAPGILLAPMSPKIAIESSRLPGKFHGDPADRLIVSTARILDATLMTRDKEIISYGAQKYVKILKV